MNPPAHTGRNSPCTCGSGKRYKHCCGALSATGTARAQPEPGSIARDPIARWLRESAGGDASAMAHLGLAYLTASGVPGNPKRGIELVDRAAALGNPEGAALAATVRATSLWRTPDWSSALEYLALAARAGHRPSQEALRILAAGPGEAVGASDAWDEQRNNVDLQHWLSPPPVETLRESPRIRSIAGFIPSAVCDWLIAQVRGRLQRATIYDKRTGGDVLDERRINSQSDLGVENMGLLTFVVRARMAALLGCAEEAMEIPKVLHYAPGETFAPHYDYLTPDEPAYAVELAQRGQRAETFLIYLNDDYEGGETSFTDLGLAHRGAKGDALWFANLDASGEPDPDTRHAGLPPTRGEKWVFSQWIRSVP